MLNQKIDLGKMESMLVCLIGLPKFLNSNSKKDRKFGKMHLNDYIIPAINDLRSQYALLRGLPSSLAPHVIEQKYFTLIQTGKFEYASKYARECLHLLRDGL